MHPFFLNNFLSEKCQRMKCFTFLIPCILCVCVCVCLSVMLKKTFDNKFSCLNIVKTQNNFSYDV